MRNSKEKSAYPVKEKYAPAGRGTFREKSSRYVREKYIFLCRMHSEPLWMNAYWNTVQPTPLLDCR